MASQATSGYFSRAAAWLYPTSVKLGEPDHHLAKMDGLRFGIRSGGVLSAVLPIFGSLSFLPAAALGYTCYEADRVIRNSQEIIKAGKQLEDNDAMLDALTAGAPVTRKVLACMDLSKLRGHINSRIAPNRQ